MKKQRNLRPIRMDRAVTWSPYGEPGNNYVEPRIKGPESPAERFSNASHRGQMLCKLLRDMYVGAKGEARGEFTKALRKLSDGFLAFATLTEKEPTQKRILGEMQKIVEGIPKLNPLAMDDGGYVRWYKELKFQVSILENGKKPFSITKKKE